MGAASPSAVAGAFVADYDRFHSPLTVDWFADNELAEEYRLRQTGESWASVDYPLVGLLAQRLERNARIRDCAEMTLAQLA